MGGTGATGKRGTTTTRCELCGGAAAVHCAADSAFLCLRCDAKVHGANFLASRHLRRRLGSGAPAAAESGGSSATSASSSSCVSTADSAESTAARGVGGCKRRRPRAEAVLEGWAKRMGFAPVPARRRGRGRAPCAGPWNRRGARPAPRRHGRRALGGDHRIPRRRRRRLCMQGRGGRAAPSVGGRRARAGEAGAHRGFMDGARGGDPADARRRRGGGRLGRVLLTDPAGPTAHPLLLLYCTTCW